MNIPKLAEYLTDIDGRYILEAAEKECKMTRKFSIKTVAAIAAACVCIISLVAAGWALFDSKDYLEDYDADPSYMIQDKMITSDGEGHYFGVIMTGRGFRLMGSDGSDGENAYNICDVPGCDHTDGSVCPALNMPEITGLSVYDGRLYWTARQKGDGAVNIMSAAPDGSDIQTVRSVPDEVYTDTLYNKYIRTHRGYMYFIGEREPEMIFDPETFTSYQKDPDEPYVLNVWAEELKENGESRNIFSFEYEKDRYYGFTSQFYANNLYIMLRSTKSDGSFRRFEVYRIDLKTGSGERIYITDEYDVQGWWLDGSETLCYTDTDPETGTVSLMRLDLNKGKPKKLCELPDATVTRVINGKAVGIGDGKVYVTDFGGNTVELDITALTEQVKEAYGFAGISLCGVDGENVILQMCDDECFALVPLDGGEPKLIIASCFSDPDFERIWGAE